MDKLRSIYASAYATVISAFVTVVLTMATEFSVPFKNWLAGFTGHHWVSKSWISIILFGVFFLIIRMLRKNPDPLQTRKALSVLIVSLVLGSIILLVFFGYEYQK